MDPMDPMSAGKKVFPPDQTTVNIGYIHTLEPEHIV